MVCKLTQGIPISIPHSHDSWCIVILHSYLRQAAAYDCRVWRWEITVIWASWLQGRYSFVGAQPSLEVVAKGSNVEVTRHPPGNAADEVTQQQLDDPLQVHFQGVQKTCAVPLLQLLTVRSQHIHDATRL